MTSPANQQNPAATTTSATTAPSYASAAGAPKEPTQAPLVAAGSQPPVVGAGSASSTQNAKGAPSAPVNGKQGIAPAIPAVARSSNTSVQDHSRKSSVTMAATGPNSFSANGGPVGGSKSGIQFGFDSPAMAHSTPSAGSSVPIPIPGGNPRIPSPAHSPSPIPQPSASGGRPPSGLQQPSGQMTFGSLSSDGERHMRQGSVPQNPTMMASQSGSHYRRESSHSAQSDNPAVPNRASYGPQGGRGRGGYNPHMSYGGQYGYPPNNQFRNGPGQGRGMPPPFQPQPRNMPYPNSPQPSRSPALVPSMPSMPNTPNMAPANMQPNMPMQAQPNFHYPPPMAPQHQQNYGGYPPQQMPMNYSFNNMPYMGSPQTNSPGYPQQYVPQPQYHPQGHTMSRSPSQPERPSSANHPPQHQPVIVSSNAQSQSSLPNPAAKSFVKPRKSAALTIKNQAGEIVDVSAFQQPASPAPGTHQSKTPPATSATPTPPPKSSTPAHGRTESQATPKTAKEIQDELKQKIRQATQATQASAEPKLKDEKQEPSKPKQPVDSETPVGATTPSKSENENLLPKKPDVADKKATQVTEEKKPREESKLGDEKPVEGPSDVQNPKDEKAKETKAGESSQKQEESQEDEMERMIREMEEADAKREKEEEEHRKRKEIEKEAAKKKEAEDSKTRSAEADRKLKEQEDEMERLEAEETERRKAAQTSGKSMSVADAIAQLKLKEAASSRSVAGAEEKSGEEKQQQQSLPESAGSKSTASEKRGSKPAALNLAPLNTKPVEPPQPSAALQSLKSARFLQVIQADIYPPGINSPNPALNAAVTKKGKTFKYDASFLLQFQKVFTEQPSVEFHQQVKTLIGDGDRSRLQTPASARQGSRGGGSGFSAMGNFGAPQVRTLPPGTTSSERLAMASGTMPRPPLNSIGSFQRPGAPFPTATSMSRTSSQSNMRNVPNSPRQSSRSTRNSRRNEYNAKDAQASKTMPLTAGQDIKPIMVSAGGWKPSSVGRSASSAPGPSGYLDPETVQRKVKAALNKMTPEKFDRISDQILEIASQSKDESDGRTLRQIIQLTFEKATDEAHWASMYAKFCMRMHETMSSEIRDERIKDKAGNVVSGGALFRKYLLNRCQEEFERGWSTHLPEPPAKEQEEAEKKGGEAVMLSDEYYIAAAAKRRGLGLVQFIGELYKLGMLTERIMHECVHKLVDYNGVPDEAEIESLCKLLRTIGHNLDQTEKGRPMMDAYFQRIQNMMELPELQSRMKFMLLDVIDLRKANWMSKEGNKGPKTLEEVRAEAEAAQIAKAQEAARNSQRGGGGRPMAGRGDTRNFSGGYPQQTSNQVAIDDLRRLKGSASRTASQNVTLGPASMFSSRSNSGRRLGPGGALGRPGEDSGVSSRTGTPPTRDSTSNSNAFSLLANMEPENPASPPSAAPSPSLSKAMPDSVKQESK
ncbi:hypothetical protein CDD82_170 [Ophiocordyceps australis]|uniref:MIF4G domain-containing protein n=1 Tax=Ophiocordyceps australis TaxID=1399860 RepID=A0A2C5YPV1_9HYPO|nr:hypothetical protein CDD82_170 [Ophiocordyceps australis]